MVSKISLVMRNLGPHSSLHRWLFLGCIPILSAVVCLSQQPLPRPLTSNTATTFPATKAPSNEDDRYRIGPADMLSIQVYGKPQLSREEQVDSRGLIRMPLLDEEIHAACRTESELAHEIARLYREHELLRNPTVYVSVKEYQSQPVAVLGSVNAPGRFIMRRSIRLRELVVFFAGGPSQKAGNKVQILSGVALDLCEASAAGGASVESVSMPADNRIVSYNLQDLLSGEESANPLIHRGDIINVPAAEEVFIIGNVARPSAISVGEATTISRALAMVGGTLPNSKKDKIRVLRQVPGKPATDEILVDLAARDKSKGAEFLLRGGDIVEVNTKGGFTKVLSDMAKVALPSITSLRIIP